LPGRRTSTILIDFHRILDLEATFSSVFGVNLADFELWEEVFDPPVKPKKARRKGKAANPEPAAPITEPAAMEPAESPPLQPEQQRSSLWPPPLPYRYGCGCRARSARRWICEAVGTLEPGVWWHDDRQAEREPDDLHAWAEKWGM
jgi:hypothetical protein